MEHTHRPIYTYSLFWIIVLVASYGTYRAKLSIDEWGLNSPQRLLWEAQDEAYQAREKKIAELNALYAHDTIGGKTPEETWQMFIGALKAGDTDLAAQYFIPEYQKEQSAYLRRVVDAGNISAMLEYMGPTIITQSVGIGPEWLNVQTGEVGDTVGVGHTFVFNKHTNIWKIYEL